jgi:hypothetical protein
VIVLGWMVGVFFGLLLGIAAILGLAVPIPALLTTLASTLGFLLPLGFLSATIIIVLIYIIAYIIGTRSIAPGLPAVTFPLAAPLGTAVPVTVASGTGELFARGVMLGLTATLNFIAVQLVPGLGAGVATWAFVVISLAIIRPIAISRIYHAVLGWSAWLFPVSYLATFVGLLLFLVNLIPAFAAGGIGAFRLDFTTGVIETTGGIVGITGFVGGGFSLGNFTFISPSPGVTAGPFMAPSISSHETGHSLNTAAMGGVVLWINAVDENIPPFAKMNLAYGELCAESHAQAMPTPPVQNDFFITLWV